MKRARGSHRVEAERNQAELFTALNYEEVVTQPEWTNGRPIDDVELAYATQGRNKVFFALSDGDDEGQVQRIHRQAWSQGEASLAFFTGPETIRVYNCKDAPVDATRPPEPLATVTVSHERAGRTLMEAAAALLELEPYGRYQVDVNPNQWGGTSGLDYLAQQMETARDRLRASGRLRDETVRSLLGRAIFVRYLSDRGSLDEDLTRQLTDGRWGRFEELLSQGGEGAGVAEVQGFMTRLSDRFNGTVFEMDEAMWSEIGPEHLQALRQIVDCEDDQLLLWKLDFSHLPIGFFSRLFELFLSADDRNAGAFYTPPEVVDFVLDQCMSIDQCEPGWRVLDPSCGSGIFLARAFHRLALRKRTRQGRTPHWGELAEILRRMRGVDINPAAIQVTALSLYLAMMEHLESDILKVPDFRLPELLFHETGDGVGAKGRAGADEPAEQAGTWPRGETLYCADFFDVPDEAGLEARSFDRIIGNPPWGRSGEKGQWKRYRAACRPEAPAELPGRSLGLAFLVRCGDLCKREGQLALMAPSEAVTLAQSSKTTSGFMEWFFANHRVHLVADLILLRRRLIHGAAGPVAVLHYAPGSPTDHDVITVLAPKYSMEGQVPDSRTRRGPGLVPLVTPADVKRIPYWQARTRPWHLRSARYMTGSDIALIERLLKGPKLGEVCEAHGLRIHGGLREKHGTKKLEHRTAGGDRGHAEMHQPVGAVAFGLPAPSLIAVGSIGPYVIDRQVKRQELQYDAYRPSTLAHVRHRGPVALLQPSPKYGDHCRDQREKRLLGALAPRGETYGNNVTGVAGGEDQVAELKWLLAFYHSSLAAWWAFHMAPRWVGGRGSIKLDDIEEMPFIIPETGRLKEASATIGMFIEAAGKSAVRRDCQAELDRLVMEVFGLSARERMAVEDTMRYAIPHFHWADGNRPEDRRPEAEKAVSDDMLELYGQWFIRAIAPVWQAMGYRLGERVRELRYVIGQGAASDPLRFVAICQSEEAAERAEKVSLPEVDRQMAPRVGSSRVSIYRRHFVDLYDGDAIYCIRPNKQRFWTRTQAIDDGAAALAEWVKKAPSDSVAREQEAP